MNVVTGVFVQTALLSARLEEDSFMQSQIVALFNMAERDLTVHSTKITWEEILESIEDPKLTKEWRAIGVQAADAGYLFKLLDLEGIGEVAFEEFMGGCLRVGGDAKAIDLLTVMQENRKNEEVSRLRFAAMTEVIIDVHETVRDSQNDVRKILASVSRGREDFHRMSAKTHSELSSIQYNLMTLSGLEDAFLDDETESNLV